VVVVGRRRCLGVPADRQRHGRARLELRAAGGQLREYDAVVLGIGIVLEDDPVPELGVAQRLLAEPRSWLVTSGTVDVVGPFDTVRLTTEPFTADDPARPGSG